MKPNDENQRAFLLIGAVCTVPLIMAANALSISLLWGWYAVPLLDLDPIGIFGAFGIGLLFGALIGDVSKPKEGKGAGQLIGEALLRPVVAIAFGWAAHFFV